MESFEPISIIMKTVVDCAILASSDHGDEVEQMAQEDVDLQALWAEGST